MLLERATEYRFHDPQPLAYGFDPASLTHKILRAFWGLVRCRDPLSAALVARKPEGGARSVLWRQRAGPHHLRRGTSGEQREEKQEQACDLRASGS